MMNMLKKFIDFDKSKKLFFDNLYLIDEKFVIKIPIVEKEKICEEINNKIKIEKFELTKYIYLITYEE